MALIITYLYNTLIVKYIIESYLSNRQITSLYNTLIFKYNIGFSAYFI